MRLVAWCLLIAALAFSAVSGRINDKKFADNTAGESKENIMVTR